MQCLLTTRGCIFFDVGGSVTYVLRARKARKISLGLALNHDFVIRIEVQL